MIGWENFFIAEVGASAALLGLIFVGVSINLTRIISLPGLPNRALLALIILLTILVMCSLLLVPGQSQTLVGIELLVVGLLVWITATRLDVMNSAKERTSISLILHVEYGSYSVSSIALSYRGYRCANTWCGRPVLVSTCDYYFIYQSHSGCVGFACRDQPLGIIVGFILPFLIQYSFKLNHSNIPMLLEFVQGRIIRTPKITAYFERYLSDIIDNEEKNEQ